MNCVKMSGEKINRVGISEADHVTLKSIDFDHEQLVDDHFDYSRVVVRKPWGYEYLLFQNDYAAVWILYLRSGGRTSLHCHPSKKTSIIILSGEALCSTFNEEVVKLPAEGMLIDEGVFHSSMSLSSEGTFLVEIEAPVNKRDLVRFRDNYGRERLGYESRDHMTINLCNYNYVSFIDSSAYYNSRIRFGHCSIELRQFTAAHSVDSFLRSHPWDAVSILKGTLTDAAGTVFASVGDSFERDTLPDAVMSDGDVEAIVVRNVDTMIRFSDLVVSYLRERGVSCFFFVPDTSNAHLTDAVGRNTNVRGFAFQTEHAAAIAAETYGKLTGRPAVLLVASGASSLNTMIGVANAWIDSVPMVVISGQQRHSDLCPIIETAARQLASKEVSIVNIVRPITKSASLIHDSRSILAELERAVAVSTECRRGPVWLDIPVDVLGMNIDESALAPVEATIPTGSSNVSFGIDEVRRALDLLKSSKRPVILAGHGLRAATAEDDFIRLAHALSVPVLTSRRGADLLPDDFPLFFGRPGTYGQRSANFVIQNCDLLICLGTRLSLPLIGRNFTAFARNAKKIVVDIDPEELRKPTVSPDIAVLGDVGDFVRRLLAELADENGFRRDDWIRQCLVWRSRFPLERELKGREHLDVDAYVFIDTLSDLLDNDEIIVVDGGFSLDYVMQAHKVKHGQRIISSPGLEHQGFSLPGAIGACLASGMKRIICLCEKKGLQLNVSELQTISSQSLPVKIFVFNSKTNIRIHQVQSSYFGGRHVGMDNAAVIGPVNISKVGEAYNIRTMSVVLNSEIPGCIRDALRDDGPVLCEVSLPEDHETVPRLTLTVNPSGSWQAKPLEDMYPFLERKELAENMLIDLLPED